MRNIEINNMMMQILVLITLSLCNHTEALESNRIDELNREYQMGAKQGYGPFINELKSKLQTTTDLKEAARLATLIRGYIHGQIIGFDKTKILTPEDHLAVLQAHATTTAFFTLSPLGTDRYREDTLRYVMKDVHGHYAQELTIVADAVQAALWAGDARTREHVTKEVLLRWMTPSYQRGGNMDVSQALGNWNYEDYQEASDIVNHTINFFWPKSDQNHDNFEARRINAPTLECKQQQRETLSFAPGTTINVPGTNNQCGFYSIGKPCMRHQDGNNGPRQKFIEGFQRAYYDPQMFWMLAAFAKNKDWRNEGLAELEDLKTEPLLNYELIVQKNPEMLAHEKKQHKAKQACLLKEFNILRNFHTFDKETLMALITANSDENTTTAQLFEKMWNKEPIDISKLLTNKDLANISRALEIILSSMKLIIQQINEKEYSKFIRETIKPAIAATPEYRDMIKIQGEHTKLVSKIFEKNVTHNQALFTIIPFKLKERIIKAAAILANHILGIGGGQLEINPGTDVDALDAANTSLDTIIAYLNDRAVNILCTEAVMNATPHMRLSNAHKKGNYYLGKAVLYENFGRMFTINHGGSSYGHYQIYSTEDTPPEAIANGLRNPSRENEDWDLRKSAQYYSRNHVPYGNEAMLQAWTNKYTAG